jgi:hypothetical protein
MRDFFKFLQQLLWLQFFIRYPDPSQVIMNAFD